MSHATVTNAKAIHIQTEQYRILKLAEESADRNDGNVFALLAVSEAIGRLPVDSRGLFFTKKVDTV